MYVKKLIVDCVYMCGIVSEEKKIIRAVKEEFPCFSGDTMIVSEGTGVSGTHLLSTAPCTPLNIRAAEQKTFTARK
jgi:hypothetical protein